MTGDPRHRWAENVDASNEAAPTVDRRRLGTELRKLREARSLRLSDVAARLGIATSTLSRIETGHAPARTAYLTILLDLYGVSDEAQRDQLVGLARGGQRKSWWTDYGELLSPGAGEYLDLEAAAVRIHSYSVHVIPGLAQTADYADAVLRAARPGLTAVQVCRLAYIQERRQALARRDLAHSRHLIIDEAALLTIVGSIRVMIGQLEHLAAITADPTATIQVLPLATARNVLSAPFTILSFADPADPAAVSTHDIGGQVTFTRRAADVHAARRTFDMLARLALPPASSVSLIEQTAATCEQQAAH